MEVNLPSELHHGVDARTYCQTPGFSLDEPTQVAGYRVDMLGVEQGRRRWRLPRRTQPRTRPSRTSGPEDQTSESHDSNDFGDPVLTKNVEEKTVQSETATVDVAKMKAELPETERTNQESEWEERQKTQSRRTNDHSLMKRSSCRATTTVSNR